VPYQPGGVSYLDVPTPIATPKNYFTKYKLKDWTAEDALNLVQEVDNFAYESDVYGGLGPRWDFYQLQKPIELSITEAMYRFPDSHYTEAFQWKLAMVNFTLQNSETNNWVITTLERDLNSGLYKPEEMKSFLIPNGFNINLLGIYDLFGPGEDGFIFIIGPRSGNISRDLLGALREVEKGVYDLILLSDKWGGTYGWAQLQETKDYTGNGIPEIISISQDCNINIYEWQGDRFVDLSKGEIKSSYEYCKYEFDPVDEPEYDLIVYPFQEIEYYNWNGEFYELVKKESHQDFSIVLHEYFWESNYSALITETEKLIEEWPLEENNVKQYYGPAFPDLLRLNLGLAYAHNSESTKAVEILQDLAQSPSIPEFNLPSLLAEAFLSVYNGNRSDILKACLASWEVLDNTTIPPPDKYGNYDFDTPGKSIGFRFYAGKNINCHLEDAFSWFIASFHLEQIPFLPTLLKQYGIDIHKQIQFDINQDSNLDWVFFVNLRDWNDLVIITIQDGSLETYVPGVSFDDVPDRFTVETLELPGSNHSAIYFNFGNGYSVYQIIKEDSKLIFEEILTNENADYYEKTSYNSTTQFDTFFMVEYGQESNEECPDFWYDNTTYQWDPQLQEFIEIDLPMDMIFDKESLDKAIPLLINTLQITQNYYHSIKTAKDNCEFAFEDFYSVRAHYLYLLGLAYELNGDEALAIQTYHQLWREHPDSAYALMVQAKLEPTE